ncbi:MAG: hypothetical protein V4754_16050 [Pseudomonadota bacterium]
MRRARPGAAGLLAMLSLACATAAAKPAPWQQWRSKVDGQVVCAQVSPGAGWEWARGPYQDSRCEKPVLAK